MTPTQDTFRSRANAFEPPLPVAAKWRVREFRHGLVVAEMSRKNLFTSYGLTNLGSLWGGVGVAPTYLVIDSFAGALTAGASTGATSIISDTKVDLAGDTQLVLNPGQATQETVSFSAVSGTGPYTYTVSALVNNHLSTEKVVRAVRQTDTMTSVQSEVQYDSVAAPGQRMQAPAGSGFSSGTGSWTMTFFLTGSQALGPSGASLEWVTLGLADSVTVGGGNLHNHLTFGFVHTSGNDVEVDITLTLANS